MRGNFPSFLFGTSIFIHMDRTKLESLIKKTICEQVIKENLTNLEHLHDNVSYRTLVGKSWYEIITALENLTDEMKDFHSLYTPQLHGPLPNTNEGLVRLQQIVQLLSEMKPIILAMDDIERNDQ